MSIKAIITEEYTMFKGTLADKLTGLSLYIQALRETKVPDELINDAIKYGFMSKKDLEKEEEELIKSYVNNESRQKANN